MRHIFPTSFVYPKGIIYTSTLADTTVIQLITAAANQAKIRARIQITMQTSNLQMERKR
jgi:hypothetical protein